MAYAPIQELKIKSRKRCNGGESGAKNIFASYAGYCANPW